MKALLRLLALLLFAFCLPACESRKLRWAHTPKCHCTCHGKEESCRSPRKAKKHMKTAPVMVEENTAEELVAVSETMPMVPANDMMMDDSWAAMDEMSTPRKYTPEQMGRIHNSIDEFESVQRAYDEWEHAKNYMRALAAQDDSVDLDAILGSDANPAPAMMPDDSMVPVTVTQPSMQQDMMMQPAMPASSSATDMDQALMGLDQESYVPVTMAPMSPPPAPVQPVVTQPAPPPVTAHLDQLNQELARIKQQSAAAAGQ